MSKYQRWGGKKVHIARRAGEAAKKNAKKARASFFTTPSSQIFTPSLLMNLNNSSSFDSILV